MTIPVRTLYLSIRNFWNVFKWNYNYRPHRTVIVTTLHAVNAWKDHVIHHVIPAAGACTRESRRSEEVWSWTRRWVDWVTGAVGKSSISPCWVRRACFPLPGICSPSFSSVRLPLYSEFFPIAEMLAINHWRNHADAKEDSDLLVFA